MTIEEVEQMIDVLPVGEYIFLENLETKEITLLRNMLFRSKSYGYEFCFKNLYGNKFYLEKLKEGNSDAWNRRVKRFDLR